MARYIEFAEYEQWIADAPALSADYSGMPLAVTGERVLDIACGQGRLSRYLARQGPDVTGDDVLAAMLGMARAASLYRHRLCPRRPDPAACVVRRAAVRRLQLRAGTDGRR